MVNYYEKIWLEPNNHGDVFWKNVDFSAPEYQYQEKIFRDYLKTLNKSEDINSVLELGAGFGRMTKIVLEELKSRYFYTVIEHDKKQINKMFDYMGTEKGLPVYPLVGDIMEFINLEHKNDYDLIIASEVFMHIRPEDIDKVIKKCCEFLRTGGHIINIDWAFEPQKSEWCWMHPYDELYTKYGAQKVNIIPMKNIKQALFHYRFS